MVEFIIPYLVNATIKPMEEELTFEQECARIEREREAAALAQLNKAYLAWYKFYETMYRIHKPDGTPLLSFDEWLALYQCKLLPNQDPRNL